MIAASLTSAAREPRRSSRRRSPTLWSAPAATTMRYDRLPRLTSTIIWISRPLAPNGRRAAQSGYQVFQGGEIGVVVGREGLTVGFAHGEEPKHPAHATTSSGSGASLAPYRLSGPRA